MRRVALFATLVLVWAFVPAPRYANLLWLMPDDHLRVVSVPQSVYAQWEQAGAPTNWTPAKPDPQARFLSSGGGLSHPYTRGMAYRFEQADDPQDGWSIVHVLDVDWTPEHQSVQRYERRIPNHHSVTFDAASSSSIADSTSDCIASHTVANQSNTYIIGGLSGRRLGSTPSGSATSVKYNSVDLTAELNANQPGTQAAIWDLVAPTHDGSAHNLDFNFSSTQTTQVCGGVSLYGVDQSTPRSHTATNTGSDTHPTGTVSSATGEIVVSVVTWVAGSNTTDTVDGTWTSDWNLNPQFSFPRGGAGAHIAGASSVTRTDTTSASVDWDIAMVSAAASGGGGGATSPPFHLLLGVGK